uniref:Conotoxin n=1 Tax=Steinernema glaseri TaxID=37863 RepID=A0A1I7YX25_9BILA
MKASFLFLALLLVFVALSSAELAPTDSFGHLRAFRFKRDWSDRVAQQTGWASWKCLYYSYPDCLTL